MPRNFQPQAPPEVIDETEDDQTVPPIQYQITSFGADFDTEGFVNRLRRDDIYIPPFQRAYVWTQKEASRFIESLLLGLPVPGVFLAREQESNRMLVIDGQQRLKTLQFFFDGYFNPSDDAKSKKVFRLQAVQKAFEGRTYSTLDENDRIALNDAIVHATIVKQESPTGEQSSIYHIFERLNTSGRKLSPQQIRVAIFHGTAIDLLHRLNQHGSWRSIYGRPSNTLKDEELILRFLGLYLYPSAYARPMKEFLNKSLEKVALLPSESIAELEVLFTKTIDFVLDALTAKAFRPERALNAAVFDSVMVGLARRVAATALPENASFREAYSQLLENAEYSELVSRATADENNVKRRIELATLAFAALEPA